ncbi:class I SAM-dependent methyltransferase [Pleurocapsa sp. FMAR1]|uniref:class I SAM-dependent methyltransferase n=1 Tax=Pleurocapsa sp. FMAR1 TaxID=3040204 RepID=UPI0029C8438B|nr:class I SAM-dependent methyltransferase [Pleurocapsa sp. FMAR1]
MVFSPITGSNNITLLRTIKAEQLITSWQDSFEIDITKELNNQQNIYLYQCNETKLKFFAPSEIVGSGKLYEKLQNFNWYYMPSKWEHKIALQDLSRCENVLEIGSAFGDFVTSAINAGFNIKGIELNEAAIDIAQKKNLPVERLDLEEAVKLYRESLDGVCSFQVLEHVTNPKDFITWSIQMLKPGGKLIYCVPNSESFLKYQDNLLDMPPHHMLQWSKKSLIALEKLFPIKVEKIIYEPLAEYHIFSYLNAYNNYFRSVFPLTKLIFNRYSLPLYEKCLRLGLRRLLIGQSIYIQFRKI